ncbi:MAG: transcriptional regulator [Rhizobiales bacterium]|nr:transcriptional regulator [Hyphomicrobiales bacterium]
MKRGPQPGSPMTRTRPIDKAREAWGADLPREIEALALACERTTAKAVAEKLGYSGALISHLLARKYPGDVALAFAKIRGVFMGEEVECPVLGTIGTKRCLDEQKRPFAVTNSIRARLFHACARCPHNRKNQEKADA